jgi:hypothetical protein
VLQEAQELDLQGRRQVRHLVQVERAPISPVDDPLAPAASGTTSTTGSTWSR